MTSKKVLVFLVRVRTRPPHPHILFSSFRLQRKTMNVSLISSFTWTFTMIGETSRSKLHLWFLLIFWLSTDSFPVLDVVSFKPEFSNLTKRQKSIWWQKLKRNWLFYLVIMREGWSVHTSETQRYCFWVSIQMIICSFSYIYIYFFFTLNWDGKNESW